MVEMSRETLVFPAMQSGGRYSGRGAVFPVESCTKHKSQLSLEWFI